MSYKIEIHRKEISDIQPSCLINGVTFDCDVGSNDFNVFWNPKIRLEDKQLFINKDYSGKVKFSLLINEKVEIEAKNGSVVLNKSRFSRYGYISGNVRGRYYETNDLIARHIGFCKKEKEVPFILGILMEMYWQRNCLI